MHRAYGTQQPALRVMEGGGVSEETQNDSCEKILTPTEWKQRKRQRSTVLTLIYW